MPRINPGETLDVRGSLALTSAESLLLKDNSISRTKLLRDDLAQFTVPATDLRVWDNFASLLPGTAAADDLAVIEGTLGTDAVTLQTSDAKVSTTTQYARFLYTLPVEYRDGEDVQVRVRAGMVTTVSDGTATVDVQAYAHDDDGAVGSDLCATAAQSINSLTKSNNDFVVTATGLSSGDTLDIRVAVAITDAATGTAVIGEISKIAMLLDAQG